jgi:hypothetical protein
MSADSQRDRNLKDIGRTISDPKDKYSRRDSSSLSESERWTGQITTVLANFRQALAD